MSAGSPTTAPGGARVDAGELPHPPGWLGAVGLHTALHLRRTLRLRRVWPALLLIALVIAAGGGIARTAAGEPRALLTFLSTLGVRGVALLALGFGTRSLRADADHGALTAFLLRPRAAVALPIGRLLGSAALVAALAVVTVLGVQAVAFAVAVPIELARLPFVIAGFTLGAVAYTALFQLFAALLRPAAGVGLAWIVLVDLGLGSVSGTLAKLTPGPSAAAIVEFDPDLSLFASAGLSLWAAVASLLVLSLAAAAATVWRFAGDAPA